MGFSMRYVSPGGREYEFLSGADGLPFVELDTVDGLVGVFEDAPVQVVGESGARVDARDRVVPRLEGSFTVVVFDREQWAQVCADFSTRVAGTLVLSAGDVVFELRVKLAVSLPFPAVVPAAGARIAVSVVADTGVWERVGSGTGVVTVSNDGDVPVWPVVVWSGAGGRVGLPSGAGFVLPEVAESHSLSLARSASGVAVPASGGRLPVADTVGEMVPVGASRRFSLPAGASLVWSVGVLNPWAHISD